MIKELWPKMYSLTLPSVTESSSTESSPSKSLRKDLPPGLGRRYDVRSLLKAILPSPTVVRYVRRIERPGTRSAFAAFG